MIVFKSEFPGLQSNNFFANFDSAISEPRSPARLPIISKLISLPLISFTLLIMSKTEYPFAPDRLTKMSLSYASIYSTVLRWAFAKSVT